MNKTSTERLGISPLSLCYVISFHVIYCLTFSPSISFISNNNVAVTSGVRTLSPSFSFTPHAHTFSEFIHTNCGGKVSGWPDLLEQMSLARVTSPIYRPRSTLTSVHAVLLEHNSTAADFSINFIEHENDFSWASRDCSGTGERKGMRGWKDHGKSVGRSEQIAWKWPRCPSASERGSTSNIFQGSALSVHWPVWVF